MNEFIRVATPRRGNQAPATAHPEQTLLGKPAYGGRLFLTQEARSREVTSISHSPTNGSASDEDDVDDENDPPKPNIEEIKKLLYKRECTRLGITPVGKFLRDAPGTKLSIRYYSLGSTGAKALAVPLMLDATITTLDLEGNDIGPEGLASMAEMLGEHCTISELNLRRNSLGSRGAAIISKVVMKMRQLSSINLAANNFADKDGPVFAQMLKENRHLRTLDLSDNSFGEVTGKALGEALAHNEILEDIDLQWNKLSGKGATHLLNGIKENIGLRRLNLSFNSISRGTTRAMGNPLVDVLSTNSTLQHLDLSGCHLADMDIACVAKGLKDNDSLETLKIGNNLFQVQSVSILLKALAINESSAIQLVDLAESVIEERALEDIDVLQSRDAKVIHGMVHQSETDFDSQPKQRKTESNESVGSGEEGEEGEDGEEDFDDGTEETSEI